MRSLKRTVSALTLCVSALPALADGPVSVPYDGDFDDATFAVESAIVDKGLVIDNVSHVGEMLSRTRGDVGSDTAIFKAADVFQFCSAVVSRKVMEINPLNIAYCPYGIFVADTENGVIIGYREYPEGEMQIVEDLLAEIVAEAVSF